MSTTVPTIDLTPWREGDEAARRAVAAAVDDAGQALGFLQVVGHGVPAGVVDAMRSATDEFFALDLAEKLQCCSPRAEVNRGYAALGTETLTYSLGVARPPDLFEAFNIGPDVVDLTDAAVAAERHRIFAPNIWPERPASLRPALTTYFAAVAELARTLTDVFALALGLPDRYFRAFSRHSTDTMRVINYERRSGDPEPATGQMRMGAHTDYGILTVLYADAVPGLQIVGPEGTWLDVLPTVGGFVVNLGDLTAQWTNDRWRSTVHRVVPPPLGTDGTAKRRSVAFFHDGDHDALIECLPTCVSDTNPARYPPVLAGEHLMGKLLGPRLGQHSTAIDTAGERLTAVVEG